MLPATFRRGANIAYVPPQADGLATKQSTKATIAFREGAPTSGMGRLRKRLVMWQVLNGYMSGDTHLFGNPTIILARILTHPSTLYVNLQALIKIPALINHHYTSSKCLHRAVNKLVTAASKHIATLSSPIEQYPKHDKHHNP